MTDLMLGLSPEFIYFQGKKPHAVSEVHHPYFLVFSPKHTTIDTIRSTLVKGWEQNKTQNSMLSKIRRIGEVETYRSFSNFQEKRKVFKVYTTESYVVPDVSSYLFFEYQAFTAEHDIPYQQRALTDLAASNTMWLLDTCGKQKQLSVLIYDIELTQYAEGKKDLPIDIIGHAAFNIGFESEKNLETEEFRFELLDVPSTWEDIPITQLISRSVEEEIDNLCLFCQMLGKYDIVSGHNIAGFDNYQLYGRIQWILKNHQENLSSDERETFQRFLSKQTRLDRSFHFGVGSEVVQLYPSTFDTYLAARKFYSFLDEFSLKAIAPFLGITIADRLYLTPSQIKMDARTLKYNKQDIQEQIGVTLNLIQQGLPLSFTTCMPFEMLLPAGAVNIWDHMALIRGAQHKKIMPPICRVKSIAQSLLTLFPGCNTKQDIVRESKEKRDQLSKDFVRVLKYGDEMPSWVEYPSVIYDTSREDEDESLGYHMPGGMTLKPDSEAHSDFIPWYHVVVADVGAMYPTILKAMNIGADTVRLATAKEDPDAWIWLKRLPKDFFKGRNIRWREITAEDSYADKGYMLGVKIDTEPGVINCAMTGIMNVIMKIKKELKEAQKKSDNAEIQRLKMMYQSMKGARNAGSVDYSQKIILQDKKGSLQIIPIGEFVDKIIEKNGFYIENINGTPFEIADVNETWLAYSVNRNGKVQLKKVKKAVRHTWNDKLIKITTKSGHTIVTPNHSVFTLKNNKIVELSAEEIATNSLIVHTEMIPYFRKDKETDNARMVGYFKDNKESLGDCYAIPVKTIAFVDSTSKYVYDISVEDNENFIDANGGILLHNTHGILAAPTVTGRQFNLWGAAAITTKGQMILADTLNYLKNRQIRVVYGDTDGIYLGCARSAGNIPELTKALGVPLHSDDNAWLTKPETALQAIKDCNKKWQTDLRYPDFELEPETHDAMIFVKHKNYLIFDTKQEKIELITKGNNFKGSDKANIARKILEKIMIEVVKENPTWDDEQTVREAVKNSIKEKTRAVLATLDLSTVELDDLTLIQSVQPAKRYKVNMDGSQSTFGKRAEALEKLIGQTIRSRVKMKFVVTKRPLPGITNPSKSGVKPIDYMYPVDLVRDRQEIDLEWYKKMIENYIQGAFGLSDIALTKQIGLDEWM